MRKKIYLFITLSSLFFLSCSNNSDSENNSTSSWAKLTFTGDDGFGIYSSCTDGTNLYIGTETNGVYKSTDNGETWNAINTGIIDKKYCKVYFLNNVLYLTTKVICPSCVPVNKIYKSTNGGESWTPIWNSLLNEYSANMSLATVENIEIIDGNIYLSMGSDLLKSTNNGINWQLVFTNPDTSFPGAIQKVIKMNNTIFILTGNGGGVFKSTNGGNSFSTLDNFNFNQVEIISLTVSNTNLFMGTGTYLNSNINRGIYISDENAIDWQLSNQDLNINQFSIARFGCLYHSNGVVYVSCSENKVYKSINNGENWQKLGDEVDSNLSSIGDRNILKNNNSLFLITTDNIYRYNL